jgi:rhodanese-related sulfurtransferase
LWKYAQRRRFLRELAVARITPEELRRRLDAGEDIVVVDLRHSMEFEAEPAMVPGAIHLLPDELDARHGEIPRDREVVLYCT